MAPLASLPEFAHQCAPPEYRHHDVPRPCGIEGLFRLFSLQLHSVASSPAELLAILILASPLTEDMCSRLIASVIRCFLRCITFFTRGIVLSRIC